MIYVIRAICALALLAIAALGGYGFAEAYWHPVAGIAYGTDGRTVETTPLYGDGTYYPIVVETDLVHGTTDFTVTITTHFIPIGARVYLPQVQR